MNFAQTVGQEIEKTVDTATSGARIATAAGITFLAIMIGLIVVLTLLRRRLLKKENRK